MNEQKVGQQEPEQTLAEKIWASIRENISKTFFPDSIGDEAAQLRQEAARELTQEEAIIAENIEQATKSR